MSESTSEAQVAPAHRGVKSWFQRARQGVSHVAQEAVQSAEEAILVGGVKVPLEKITPETVAWKIYTSIGNPFQKDRYVNGFTIPLILSNMGYIPKIGKTDYKEEFSEAHLACRKAVQRLIDLRIVEAESSGKPDYNNERLQYRVVNVEDLDSLAEQGRVQLLQK